jgi:hypothetical protein
MVDKFVSINLLGENPKQEKRRLVRERIKLILIGKSPREVRRGGKDYLLGTTRPQRELRRRSLRKSGLRARGGIIFKAK